MKIIVAAILAICAGAIWWAAAVWWAAAGNEVVEITNPCSTFVSEFSPMRTPVVAQVGDQWWVTISYTPAPDREASRVYHATWLGERTFEVKKTGRLFRARDASGHLQIKLNSKDSAKALLSDLCFAV